MKYARKSLWLLAVAGLLSVAMVSGCGNDKDATSLTKTGNGGGGGGNSNSNSEPVIAGNMKFNRIQIGTDVRFKHIAESGDGKIYVSADDGKKLVYAVAADLANDKWTGINLGDTGLDGTAGKSKLAGANIVNGIHNASNGVLVDLAADAKGESPSGVAYVEGGNYVAAWSNAKDDVVRWPTPGLGDNATDNLSVTGVFTKGNEVYPVFYKAGLHGCATGTPLSAGGKITQTLLWSFTGVWPATKNQYYLEKPRLIQVGDDALVIGSNNNATGKKNDIRLVKANEVADAAKPTIYTTDLKADYRQWYLEGAVGRISSIYNQDVSVAAVHNNVLYIGFRSNDKKYNIDGGVIAYNIEMNGTAVSKITPARKTGDKTWGGISVKSLLVNGDDVVALTDKGLIKVAADGANAGVFTAEGLPETGVNAGIVVGNTYVVATDAGVFQGTKK